MSSIKPAAGGQITTVFRTVRIAKHHDLTILLSRQMFGVDGLIQNLADDFRSRFQVADLFKQRSDS